MSETEDMFKTRITLNPMAKDVALIESFSAQETALSAVLAEIEESKLALPGVVFCKAIIQKCQSEIIMRRSGFIYRLAARHGINLDELSAVHTERKDGVTTLILFREGAE